MTDQEWKAYQAQQNTAAAWMREVQRTEGWRHYEEFLLARIAEETELMLQGDITKFEYRKGLIEGLRVAKALPDLIIAQAEVAHAHQ